MQKRLFLKQKDYEMIKFKSQIRFNQSRNDPLLNPSNKHKKQKARAGGAGIGGHRNNLFDDSQSIAIEEKNKKKLTKVNPLDLGSTTNKIPLQNIKLKQPDAQGNNLQNLKQIQTPWTKILESFIKNYDFLKYPMDLQVANPFGSYGLRVQDQLKGISAKESKTTNNSKMTQKSKDGLVIQRTTITIKTYLKILEIMKRELEQKWLQQDKVGCLQIAIQACKLLHDTSNAKFLALKFAYVIEIVDRFGIMVFERINKLSFPQLQGQKLQQINIKSLQQSNIPESSQQICRNWLLKIASIRELMPRTIIQSTLLRLHCFINNGIKAKSAFQRLYKSNRCFGEYINCIFFCTFLLRMGKEIFPQDKNYIIEVLEDVFFYVKEGKNKFGREDVSIDEFFSILEPFFITSFESLAQNIEKEKFKKFFTKTMPPNPHFIILKNFIQSFSPSCLVIYACEIARLIQKTADDQKYILYKKLLTQIRSMVFPQSGEFIVLVWSDINLLNDIETLLQVLGPFSQIIFKNLPTYQKNKFYGLILDKFSGMFQNFNQRTLNKKRVQKFQAFLSQIISRTQDLKDIVTLEPFLQLISYFPQKSKQQISYNIIKTFVLGRENEMIKDPIVVHIMLSLIKNLSGYKIGKNGSQSQLQELIIKFLNKVQFEGKQLQQYLTFYGQIRATFGYFQKVTTSLIYKAANLTYKARKLSKNKITNKLISFLQATIAFCYITIPVLQRPQLKLKLYIFLSQVALTNNLISQTTSFIKTCITQLSQIQLKTDLQLYEIFSRIVSFMLVIPDDPEKDFLFLFNGLYQAFQVSKFHTPYEQILKFQFYISCIKYLSCQAQQKLPFHIQGVVSNDGLFKSVEFKQALIEKIYQIFQKLEKTVDLLSKLSTTDHQLDYYITIHYPQHIMTLIDTFEDSQRIKSLLTKSIKIITAFKDKSLRKQNPSNCQKIKKIAQGFNQKLKENGYSTVGKVL